MGAVQTFAQPDLVVNAQPLVGEGPVWDHRSGRLCWVDIDNGNLFENDLVTGEQKVSSLGTMLGAAAPRQSAEGFAVAVAEGLGIWSGGQLTISDPVLPESHLRMNDAKCDSRGRLWAGSTHMDFVPGLGALHRWDGAAASVKIATGFALPNGIGWSPDDAIMYLVDSITHTLMSASYHPDEGKPGVFTPLRSIGPGWPDGLTVDLDGCVWVAVWGSSEVRRYNSDGEHVGTVPVPVSQPSSCAFGDDGMLYITSATAGLSTDDLAREPLAGSIFALSTTTLGVPVHPFAG